jgi:hypothetical protein
MKLSETEQAETSPNESYNNQMRIIDGSTVAVAVALGVLLAASAAAQPPPTRPPVPKPFPGAAAPPVVGAGDPQLTPELLEGAPVYPAAEFLDSFAAGRGQRLYVYGTNVDYESIVSYYQSVFRTRGRKLFEAPAMQQFDLARFDDDTMLLQPSVVVKDYTWNGSEGYLFFDGATEKRYKTIIQIVPAPDDGGRERSTIWFF